MDISSEKANIQTHVEKGNYHAAINLAISAMNECRRNNDQTGVDTFLHVIKEIVQTMTDEFGSNWMQNAQDLDLHETRISIQVDMCSWYMSPITDPQKDQEII